MNRHLRRAAAAKKNHPAGITEGLSELVGIAARLQPYLAQIEELKSELESTTQLLRELRTAIVEQREVFIRMFARGMGVSLDTVLSMENEIQHALETLQPDTEVPAQNPGA